MPIHDWTRVELGIFHAFHLGWTADLSRILNARILPYDYYALPERHACCFEPDVLTHQELRNADDDAVVHATSSNHTGLTVAPPQLAVTAESEMEFYRRKQMAIAVHHVSDDRIVAMIEVVSPGNKLARHALRSFVEKSAEFLNQHIHLLVIDLLPPGNRAPHGIHAAIWEEIDGREYRAPAGKPLTLAAYETALSVRAYIHPIAVGDSLPDMPLFLEPNGCVQVPLESTYQTAFSAMPRRWRQVLETAPSE